MNYDKCPYCEKRVIINTESYLDSNNIPSVETILYCLKCEKELDMADYYEGKASILIENKINESVFN